MREVVNMVQRNPHKSPIGDSLRKVREEARAERSGAKKTAKAKAKE